jgi:hypothetical protein
MKLAIQTHRHSGRIVTLRQKTPKVVNIIDALSERQPKLAPRSPCNANTHYVPERAART